MPNENSRTPRSEAPTIGVYAHSPLIAETLTHYINSWRQGLLAASLSNAVDLACLLSQARGGVILISEIDAAVNHGLLQAISKPSALGGILWLASANGAEPPPMEVPCQTLPLLVRSDEFLARLDAAVRIVPRPSEGQSPYRPKFARRSLAKASGLTRREEEVLRLVSMGHSVRECASLLGIAESTVDNHKGRLMQKTGKRKSTELVRLAIRLKLIDA